MSPPYKEFHDNDMERLPYLSLRDRCAHRSWQSPAVGLYALRSSYTRLPRRCAPRNDIKSYPNLSLRDRCAHRSWQSPAVGLYALRSSYTRLPRRFAPRNDIKSYPNLSLRDRCAHWSWQSPAVGLYALRSSYTRLHPQGVCRIRNARSSRTAALPRRFAPRNDTERHPLCHCERVCFKFQFRAERSSAIHP